MSEYFELTLEDGIKEFGSVKVYSNISLNTEFEINGFIDYFKHNLGITIEVVDKNLAFSTDLHHYRISLIQDENQAYVKCEVLDLDKLTKKELSTKVYETLLNTGNEIGNYLKIVYSARKDLKIKSLSDLYKKSDDFFNNNKNGLLNEANLIQQLRENDNNLKEEDVLDLSKLLIYIKYNPELSEKNRSKSLEIVNKIYKIDLSLDYLEKILS